MRTNEQEPAPREAEGPPLAVREGVRHVLFRYAFGPVAHWPVSPGAAWATFREEVAPLNDLPKRKRPVHLPPRWLGQKPIIVFVTVGTKDRKPILARQEVYDLLVSVWEEADA